MEKHSKYFTNFYARLVMSQLSKGTINMFLRKFSKTYGTDKYVTAAEMELLDRSMQKIKPRCMPEHELSGIAFLFHKAFTPKGNPRQTAHGKLFGPEIQLFLQSHRKHLRIHWVDTSWIGDTLAAVYEVSTTHAVPYACMKSFQYCATPWQSGGHFEILSRELNK